MTVTDYPRNAVDTDRLREEWRLLANEFNALDDNYQRLKDGLDIFYGELVQGLMDQGMNRLDAGRTAKICDQYRGYMRKMHDARRKMKDAEIKMKDADRIYWDQVNREATERAERRMSR